ncbi:MAG: class III extradiol dioxygenase subunit B-like domain-containing protein [Lachnospiraceae bacterium]|jgi:aromatic ring-opening dioxygenase LigB subunit|nr:class III extradiol dioxygenase subunit B-like domain-containing protein [Lachnospiraceae bacterium]
MLLAGYIVPHPPIAVHEIGRGEELKIRATLDSYEEVAKDIGRLRPETIIVTSPHSVMYSDYFHISSGDEAVGNFSQFRASQVRFSVRYDQKLRDAIVREAQRSGFPAGISGERDPMLDHGTMVPLYFINKEYQDYELIRIGLSGLPLKDHWKMGRMIRKAIDETGRQCVFVASGDLSHCQKEDGPYGYRPEGPDYDKKIMDVMGDGNFEELMKFDEKFLERSMECGHRSFTIMGGAFEGTKVKVKKLSHEATFGVGYGFCIYHSVA